MEYKCKIRIGVLMLILFVVFLLKDLGVWGLANIEAGTIFLFLVGIIMIKMGCHGKKFGDCCSEHCDAHLEKASPKKTSKKK